MSGSGPAAKTLRRVLADGVDPALTRGGFARDGRRQVWVRDDQVAHVVAIGKRYGTLSAQWGVYTPELAVVLWAAAPEPIDVAYSFMGGHMSGVIKTRADGFEIGEAGTIERQGEKVSFDDFIPALQRDMGDMATWLKPLTTRATVRDYLLANRDATDRRGFIVPAKLPLKLLVCAGLAILDGAPEATSLTDEAIASLAPWNRDGQNVRVAAIRALATKPIR